MYSFSCLQCEVIEEASMFKHRKYCFGWTVETFDLSDIYLERWQISGCCIFRGTVSKHRVHCRWLLDTQIYPRQYPISQRICMKSCVKLDGLIGIAQSWIDLILVWIKRWSYVSELVLHTCCVINAAIVSALFTVMAICKKDKEHSPVRQKNTVLEPIWRKR